MSSLRWEVVVGKEMGEEGAEEEVGGWGGFSILLWYFSLCRSFFSFSPPCSLAPWMETRLSRLSGDRQYGPDNGPQSKEGEQGGGGRATGEEGAERCISLQSTDTLLNYSALLLSLSPPHTLAFGARTHTPLSSHPGKRRNGDGGAPIPHQKFVPPSPHPRNYRLNRTASRPV